MLRWRRSRVDGGVEYFASGTNEWCIRRKTIAVNCWGLDARKGFELLVKVGSSMVPHGEFETLSSAKLAAAMSDDDEEV